MNTPTTLRVLSARYANGYADLNFCEADADGNEDGHESDRWTFDMLAAPQEAAADIRQQAQEMAEARGLELEF